MRTALIASFSLCWIAGTAFAQTGSQPAPKPPDNSPPPASSPAPGAKKDKTDPGSTVEKRPESDGRDGLGSCLEMWEPATHMTRQQWARACRRVAERLKDLTAR